MKKILIFLLVTVFAVSMFFIGIGCRQPEVIIETVVETVTEIVEVEVEVEVPAEVYPPVTIEGTVYPIGLGPGGHEFTPSSDIYLEDHNLDYYIEMARSGDYSFAENASDEIKEAVKGKTAAIVMHWLPDDWTQLQIKGISETLEAYGVEVVSITGAEFIAEKQIANLENVMTMGVDIIFAAAVDVAAEGPIFQEVADSGIEFILTTVLPDGMEWPDDYTANVASTDRGLGIVAADQMAHFFEEMGKTEALVGILDVNFPVPNNIERVIGFTSRCAELYPWIEIGPTVLYNGTMESAYEFSEGTLTARTDLDGFFCDWAGPAYEMSNAARVAGYDPNEFVITTVDLTEYIALEMASDGFVKGVGAQDPYACGVAEAICAVKSFLGEDNAPYITTNGYGVTKNNLVESFEYLLLRQPPEDIMAFLE